jgi:hypothetical protein
LKVVSPLGGGDNKEPLALQGGGRQKLYFSLDLSIVQVSKHHKNPDNLIELFQWCPKHGRKINPTKHFL